MKAFTPIDLGQLPDPTFVEQIDFEQILAERKAYAVSLWPAEQRAEVAATLALESEPLTKLLQENAYREMLWRQRGPRASPVSARRSSGFPSASASFRWSLWAWSPPPVTPAAAAQAMARSWKWKPRSRKSTLTASWSGGGASAGRISTT
jgi:hypothetical protein